MKEVPIQHLLFPTVYKVLSGVWHGEESELPVVIQVGAGHFGGVAVAWEDVLGEDDLLHHVWVFNGEGDGEADAFVVGEDVCFFDEQVVKDSF
jgi:hypothetical protein